MRSIPLYNSFLSSLNIFIYLIIISIFYCNHIEKSKDTKNRVLTSAILALQLRANSQASGATVTSIYLPAGLPEEFRGYDIWTKENKSRLVDNYHGSSDVYINLSRSQALTIQSTCPVKYTDGTIIIKESFDSTNSLSRITIMKKKTGSSSANSDWTFLDYPLNRSTGKYESANVNSGCTISPCCNICHSGIVTQSTSFPNLASNCFTCHSNKIPSDYAFTTSQQ